MLVDGKYDVPLRLKLQRALMRGFFGTLLRILLKIDFEGFDNIPESGPYIIAYNHTSLLEPPLVLAFWPTQPEGLSGHDVWDRPGQGQMVKLYGATPVKRGEYDRQGFDVMTAQLKAGQSIAISPEGGQSPVPKLRQAHAGVAFLIERMDVPIIPVAVSGTYKGIVRDAFRGKRPEIKFQVGEVFSLPPIKGKGKEKRETRQKNADEIMIRIALMLPEKYRGYYSDKL